MITSLWVQHALSWNQLVPLADGAIWPPIMNEGMSERGKEDGRQGNPRAKLR